MFLNLHNVQSVMLSITIRESGSCRNTDIESISGVPFSGWVKFFISEWDTGNLLMKETVTINIENKTQIETFDIDLEIEDGYYIAKMDLDEASLAALGDGTQLAVGIAPGVAGLKNTFSIERVKLHVEAHSSPVPEPGIMLLLVPTLIGLAACGRKSTKKNKA